MDCLGNLVMVSFGIWYFLAEYKMVLMRERESQETLRATKEIREGPKCQSIPQLVNLPVH